MEYHEFAPASPLRRFVECLWTLTGQAAELKDGLQPVLPDGRCEIVVHFGDPFERLTLAGGSVRQASVLFAGQLDGQLILRPRRRIGVLGVRLHPFGAAAFVEEPQHRLLGTTDALINVSAPLAHALEEVRTMTEAPDLAVAHVERVLLPLARPERIDPRVRAAAVVIQQSGGLVSVETLARQTEVTRRHLERRFLDVVGVTPKRLVRLTRFQRALAALHAGGRGAATALDCGYADQSHFIRDFRRLAGCSPSAHAFSSAQLTRFFTL